jgi:hypothetical protein
VPLLPARGLRDLSRSESGKTEFIAMWMSRSDAEALRFQADQCGLTVSALIRRRWEVVA